jgi:hypothetical protein
MASKRSALRRRRSAKASKKTSKLILGWTTVNSNFEPEYWLIRGAKPRRNIARFLVSPSAEKMANHTIIVAQSGSGKSFFVGRLVEEILLRTKSRILILDPNSDFRTIALTVPTRRWQSPRYDQALGTGYLPHELTQSEFRTPWERKKKRVYSAGVKESGVFTPIQLDWLKFPVDWFAGDGDLPFDSQLRHCHAFMNVLSEIVSNATMDDWREENLLLDFARTFCRKTKDLQEPKKIAKELRKDLKLTRPAVRTRRLLETAARHRSFVLDQAEQFYFSIAQEAKQSKILALDMPVPKTAPVRIHVLDLPSIEKSLFRNMAVSNYLEDEWRDARERWNVALQGAPEHDVRAPTFIVVEEAHNLIPAIPTNREQRSLLDQFRMIAAEGRKFGVFLVLVSQRPDKLDPLVISECENRAIMKMNSPVVLDRAKQLLGLSEKQKIEADKCLTFGRGRALLCGPWAECEHVILYAAMRRTKEGGRDLVKEHWAVP